MNVSFINMLALKTLILQVSMECLPTENENEDIFLCHILLETIIVKLMLA